MRRLALLIVCAVMPFLAQAGETVPNTLDEAFAALDQLLPPEDRHAFKMATEEKAITRGHMAIGLYIRNEWFRSGKSKLSGKLREAGARSLDDASSMVLTSYWRHLNSKPINLKEQGECYTKWWTEQQRLEKEARAKGENGYGTPTFSCP